jgi:hypothetical protein
MDTLLQSLYLFTGLSYLGNPPTPPPDWYYAYDRTDIQNPYMVIGAGIELPLNSRFSLKLEYQHECSVPNANDIGSDSARLIVTWRPFKRN